MAYPELAEPAYRCSRATTATACCPGVDEIPPDSVTLLETNPRFVAGVPRRAQPRAQPRAALAALPDRPARARPMRRFWDRIDGETRHRRRSTSGGRSTATLRPAGRRRVEPRAARPRRAPAPLPEHGRRSPSRASAPDKPSTRRRRRASARSSPAPSSPTSRSSASTSTTTTSPRQRLVLRPPGAGDRAALRARRDRRPRDAAAGRRRGGRWPGRTPPSRPARTSPSSSCAPSRARSASRRCPHGAATAAALFQNARSGAGARPPPRAEAADADRLDSRPAAHSPPVATSWPSSTAPDRAALELAARTAELDGCAARVEAAPRSQAQSASPTLAGSGADLQAARDARRDRRARRPARHRGLRPRARDRRARRPVPVALLPVRIETRFAPTSKSLAHPHLPRPDPPRRPRARAHRRRARRRRAGTGSSAGRRSATRAGRRPAWETICRRGSGPAGPLPRRRAPADEPRPRRGGGRPDVPATSPRRAASWTRAVRGHRAAGALGRRRVPGGPTDRSRSSARWSTTGARSPRRRPVARAGGRPAAAPTADAVVPARAGGVPLGRRPEGRAPRPGCC